MDGTDFSRVAGSMIVDVMLEFRKNLPRSIPFTDKAFMYLQDFDEGYGWPSKREGDMRKRGRLQEPQRES